MYSFLNETAYLCILMFMELRSDYFLVSFQILFTIGFGHKFVLYRVGFPREE